MSNNKERIYSESEIKRVLAGLAKVYLMQPWYMKPFWKQWYNAIEAVYISFCGDIPEVSIVDEVEDFLNSK